MTVGVNLSLEEFAYVDAAPPPQLKAVHVDGKATGPRMVELGNVQMTSRGNRSTTRSPPNLPETTLIMPAQGNERSVWLGAGRMGEASPPHGRGQEFPCPRPGEHLGDTPA